MKDFVAGIAALLAQERGDFYQVGRAQFEKQQAALEFLRYGTHWRRDDDELAPVAAALVDVPQAAADAGGLAQGLVKVHQVEDGGVGIGGDEIEHAESVFGAGSGRLAVAMHPVGQGPGKDRHRIGGEEAQAHFAKHPAGALLFRGADVGERTARFEDFAKDPGGAAFGRRGSCGWLHRTLAGVLFYYRRTRRHLKIETPPGGQRTAHGRGKISASSNR